jgi:hypothetical protein
MVFIELFGTVISGAVFGGLAYFLVTAGILQLTEQIDLISPAVLSVMLFGLLIGWKFEYSLTVFFANTSSEVTNVHCAVSSITNRLRYVFLIIGYILGTKVSYWSVSR